VEPWIISLLGAFLVVAACIASQVKLFGRYSEQLEEQKKTISGENGLTKQISGLTITCTKLETSVSGLQSIVCNGLPERVRLLEIDVAVIKNKLGEKRST